MIAEVLLSPGTWTGLALLAALHYRLFFHQRPLPFPLANKSPSELQDARALITDSLARNNGGPVVITLASGARKILLPASLTAWVKSNRDLDHQQLVREDFFAGVPGFEPLTVLHAPDSPLIDIVKTRLGPSDVTARTVNASLDRSLHDVLGDGDEWHAVDWCAGTMGIIARAASSVFVGPEKADDQEWLAIAQGYVMAYFAAVRELAAYPAWSRGLVHWFLPSVNSCRKLLARARVIMKDVLVARGKKAEQARREGGPVPEYDDALAWVQAAQGPPLDPADAQLSLAMAAFFTTAELLRAVLVEIARHPEVVEELRKEVSTQISKYGVSFAGVNDMVLLDSFMKEAQRLGSGLVVLERAVLQDTALPDGRIIPRDSHIMVDSMDLWNPDIYPNPDTFDGRRFLKKREAGDKASQFVQSSPDYNVFGGGRHICPGRFFAAQELKLVLAHVLLKYDVRLADGCVPKAVLNGYTAMADPTVRFEARRRKGGNGEILH